MTDPTAKGYTASTHHSSTCPCYSGSPENSCRVGCPRCTCSMLPAKSAPATRLCTHRCMGNAPCQLREGHDGYHTNWNFELNRAIGSESEAAPESEDEASPLPVEEKFTLYLDDEGDYIIQANREAQGEFIAAHGSTPDEAVYAMRQTLDLCSRARLDAERGR